MTEPNALLSDFTNFFDDVPDGVRRELSYMLVMTSDEAASIDPAIDVERVARKAFQAETSAGRIGEVLKAAAVFDVYFALDTRQRFTGMLRNGPHAHHVRAIDAARETWRRLRTSTLSPAAIAAALVPPPTTRRRFATESIDGHI